ncbi:MAG: EamA family transporter, partial [Chloroflexi bacterium]|nr:EamA family transporter [Chloroflexota bacterium]
LDEPVTLAKVLGILLAVAAVLSLADLRGFAAIGRSRLRSMLYLLAATLAFGIAGALNKEAINQGSPTVPLVIVQTITFTAASFIHMLATRRVRPNGTTLRFAPLVGLLQLTWTALLFQSLQTGDASISFPIVQLSFVLTAILAVAFLREAVTRNLVIGLSAASLAVIAFALA